MPIIILNFYLDPSNKIPLIDKREINYKLRNLG